ncbi:unnamed protein product [Ilex paraguariensis]|uniref:Uncharacterized protein n=1 Tax=Ilex paraguariensis TaxID=185542 RepID=A0ABC8THD0_9AQUA
MTKVELMGSTIETKFLQTEKNHATLTTQMEDLTLAQAVGLNVESELFYIFVSEPMFDKDEDPLLEPLVAKVLRGSVPANEPIPMSDKDSGDSEISSLRLPSLIVPFYPWDPSLANILPGQWNPLPIGEFRELKDL